MCVSFQEKYYKVCIAGAVVHENVRIPHNWPWQLRAAVFTFVKKSLVMVLTILLATLCSLWTTKFHTFMLYRPCIFSIGFLSHLHSLHVHPALPTITLLYTQITNTRHSWQNGTRCRVLWCHSHLVLLVFWGFHPRMCLSVSFRIYTQEPHTCT